MDTQKIEILVKNFMDLWIKKSPIMSYHSTYELKHVIEKFSAHYLGEYSYVPEGLVIDYFKKAGYATNENEGFNFKIKYPNLIDISQVFDIEQTECKNRWLNLINVKSDENVYCFYDNQSNFFEAYIESGNIPTSMIEHYKDYFPYVPIYKIENHTTNRSEGGHGTFMLSDYDPDEQIVLLIGFYIDPTYRRQGNGKAMFLDVIESVKEIMQNNRALTARLIIDGGHSPEAKGFWRKLQSEYPRRMLTSDRYGSKSDVYEYQVLFQDF